MAATLTAVNPELYSGPVMETVDQYVKDGQSWKAGQFLYSDTAGRLVACASDADAGTGGIKFLALEDQTDPGAEDSDKATVGVITTEHEFIGNELDGAVTSANLGVKYGIDVTSNVVTVDVGDTTNDAVYITRLGSDISPVQYKTDDIKAKVVFKLTTAVIEADPA